MYPFKQSIALDEIMHAFFYVLFLFDVVDFTFVSHCRESFTNLIISQMITNGSFIMAALKYTSFTARFIACP